MSKTRLILMSVVILALLLTIASFMILSQQSSADYNAASTAIVERQLQAIATARASTPDN